MIKRGVALVVLLLIVALRVTPARPANAQCTAPGCDMATSVVAAARATARVILTESAPRPTETPVPTQTAAPASTPTPTPTLTPTLQPTNTPTQAPTAPTAAPAAPAAVVVITTTPGQLERTNATRAADADVGQQRLLALVFLVVAIAILLAVLWLLHGRVRYVSK